MASVVLDIASGYQKSEILYVVTKLKVADVLKDGPKSGKAIAEHVKANVDRLERLLRAASALGIFTRDPTTLEFSINDVSRTLVDGPDTLRYVVLHHCEPPTVRSWLALDQSVEKGVFAFEAVFGKNYFQYIEEHPESQDRFNRAMTGYSRMWNAGQALTVAFDFSHVKSVVDVGGSQGVLISQLLRANPHLHGTVFDLPHVIKDTKDNLYASYLDIHSRLTLAPGSFFESVPVGDVHTLKMIIHDWDDGKAADILRTIGKSLPEKGKILLIERVIQEVGDGVGSFMDLHMLALGDAKERTEKQFRDLFHSAGLQLARVIPLPPTPYYAIEGEHVSSGHA